MQTESQKESELIKIRYENRNKTYDYWNASVYMSWQEKEREILELLKNKKMIPFENKKVLEIGCGHGSNVLQWLHFGLLPENIYANELLEDRLIAARNRLSSGIHFISGSASEIDLDFQFDIVYQSTVFTSILDEQFKKAIATKMWELTRDGGGVLWYDFMYDNPRNQDVKGVKLKEIRELFPDGKITYKKITLAPPISRIISKIHPNLYTLLNCSTLLRTHILAWIQK